MNKRSGFTLVEILIAISISALILGALSTTLDALVTSERSINTSSMNDRVARLLMDRLTRELISAYRGSDSGTLVGTDNGMTDEITFVTLAYGAPRNIRIRWTEGKLMRDETELTRPEPNAAVALPGITELGLRYHDGRTWLPSWPAGPRPHGIAVQLRIGEKMYGTIIAL